jgi:hypothetical protein
MKGIKLLLLLSLISSARGVSQDKSYSDDPNWKSLFNGKNLDGWVIQSIPGEKGKTYWKVDNGTIFCNSLGDPNHDHVWLQSEGEFQNFELRLKFQAYKESPGNSGVQVRSRYNENALAPGGYWLDGPQIDIDPPTQWRTGLIYDETFEEKRWIYPSLKNWEIDKSYAPEKVIFVFGNDNDEWNDLLIICKGNNIITWLNNVMVVDYDGTGILDNEHHVKRNVDKKGHIAFQLHVKDQLKIRYKDIYIRELSNEF